MRTSSTRCPILSAASVYCCNYGFRANPRFLHDEERGSAVVLRDGLDTADGVACEGRLISKEWNSQRAGHSLQGEVHFHREVPCGSGRIVDVPCELHPRRGRGGCRVSGVCGRTMGHDPMCSGAMRSGRETKIWGLSAEA